jgi:hypothetical protein
MEKEIKKMSWEDIEKVNSEITTVDIKGKPYAEVNKRIIAFRKLMPNGLILPKIEKLDNGLIVMSCEIYDEDNKLLAKAHSYEKEDYGFINKTSYIENCETSVIGRALGICGFGIDNSVASAEEVDVAIKKQDILNNPISEERLQEIKDLIEETSTDIDKFLKFYKLKSLNDITLSNVLKIEESLINKKEKLENKEEK